MRERAMNCHIKTKETLHRAPPSIELIVVLLPMALEGSPTYCSEQHYYSVPLGNPFAGADQRRVADGIKSKYSSLHGAKQLKSHLPFSILLASANRSSVAVRVRFKST